MQRTRAVICKGISRRENDLLTKAGFDSGYKIQPVLSFHYVPGIVIVTSHTLFLLICIIIVSDTNFYAILNNENKVTESLSSGSIQLRLPEPTKWRGSQKEKEEVLIVKHRN